MLRIENILSFHVHQENEKKNTKFALRWICVFISYVYLHKQS